MCYKSDHQHPSIMIDKFTICSWKYFSNIITEEWGKLCLYVKSFSATNEVSLYGNTSKYLVPCPFHGLCLIKSTEMF